MRCPDCNKFPAFQIEDPEFESGPDISEGQITGQVHLKLVTECCSADAKETYFDIELDLSQEILDAFTKAGYKDVDITTVDMEVSDGGLTADERYQRIDRHGKPIRNPRYMKKFYTVETVFTVTASIKGDGGKEIKVTVDGEWSDECQASGMDELA